MSAVRRSLADQQCASIAVELTGGREEDLGEAFLHPSSPPPPVGACIQLGLHVS